MNYDYWYRRQPSGHGFSLDTGRFPRPCTRCATAIGAAWRDYRVCTTIGAGRIVTATNYSDRSVRARLYGSSRYRRTWETIATAITPGATMAASAMEACARLHAALRRWLSWSEPRLYDMPDLVRIPGRGVYYVQDSDYDVYRNGNYWYLNYNGDWYARAATAVPGSSSDIARFRATSIRCRRGIAVTGATTGISTMTGALRGYGDNTYYGGTNTEPRSRSGSVIATTDPISASTASRGSFPCRVRAAFTTPRLRPGRYRYGNNWYMNYNGDWYRAGSYNGPWLFVGYRSYARCVPAFPRAIGD